MRPYLVFVVYILNETVYTGQKGLFEMIKSMTGYGRGECRTDAVGYTVEIRSVNHRFSDFTIKMPRDLLQFEDRMRRMLGEKILRGKADVYVTLSSGSSVSRTVQPDIPLIAAYKEAIQTAAEACGVPCQLDSRFFFQVPDGLTVTREETDSETLWAVLAPALEQAIQALLAMREVEGAKLKENLLEILAHCEEYFTAIRERAPLVPEDYKARLYTRLQELTKQVADEQRLAAEVAIFADRACIDEEITRFESHLAQFRSILASEETVGKKLDFLVQEMNREVNTMGSKANDITITNQVLLLKSEIEKIREQIQNIE